MKVMKHATSRGVLYFLTLAIGAGSVTGCTEQAQDSDNVGDEVATAAVTQEADNKDVGANLADPATIVVRLAEPPTSAAAVGAALFPGACAVEAGGPLPVGISHPSGVLTWMLHGGTVFQKGHYCQLGKAKLIMQPDGNLVVYDENNHARWASNTAGAGHHTQFQPDGNFVVYDASNHALWASNTCCNQGYNLHVQEDGNVVIYAPGWSSKWATHTNH
jgi:hypothetical protein